MNAGVPIGTQILIDAAEIISGAETAMREKFTPPGIWLAFARILSDARLQLHHSAILNAMSILAMNRTALNTVLLSKTLT